MGAIHVTVTIRNPAEPDRAWDGLFLVDTGATDCLVPRQWLESIGLAPKGQRTYELADGSELRMGTSQPQTLSSWGKSLGPVNHNGRYPQSRCWDVTALESVGIEVDPRNQTLKRLPAVRLKGFRG